MFEDFGSYFSGEFVWVVVVGGILSFLLGFGMGANDVSNAFGTSVGSKVLSLRNAYILATIFETAGAILVGFKVTDSMRKGIVDLQVYEATPNELLLGQLAILGGASIWLLLATKLKAPVSTTHSVVGATLGFTLLARGTHGIQWMMVLKIASSWIISPVLSGSVAITMYLLVDHFILRKKNPVAAGIVALPFIYFVCISFNSVACSACRTFRSGSCLRSHSSSGLSFALVFYFFLSPHLLKWIDKTEGDAADRYEDRDRRRWLVGGDIQERTGDQGAGEKRNSDVFFTSAQLAPNASPPLGKLGARLSQSFATTPKGFIRWFLPDRNRTEDRRTLRLFSALQCFTACFAGFAHGANDVSNAIAPLAALLAIKKTHSVDQQGQTQIEVLLWGVLATCIGLWVLGHRTVGQRMSEINPASGFTIEFGAAATAMLASKAGIPISTTHCLVGAVVAVGCVKSGEGVDFKIFRNIVLSWSVPSSLNRSDLRECLQGGHAARLRCNLVH
ncbi:Phosphate transporter [Aphelenchoides fujianensis]|nr:Phosphate transporter [Aphelenchoides fujianensis]